MAPTNTTTANGTRISVLARSATDAQPFDRWNADATQLRERLAMTETALHSAQEMLMGVACQSGDVVPEKLRERLRDEALKAIAVLRSAGRDGVTALQYPTEHEKSEWSRMARAAYAVGRNDIGARFSVAATLRKGEPMALRAFDRLQAEYRGWLVFGEWGAAQS